MIDLHTHTLFSDGELLPYELVRRAEHAGYKALAITDHVDPSNLEFVLKNILSAVKKLRPHAGISVLAGVEITHVPPQLIAGMVKEARSMGAEIIVIHGETLAEPVRPGTNRAAIEARPDILSHPGLITKEDAELAAKLGVALEITARKGHCISNGHVAKSALAAGAAMVVNTDAHSPSDLISIDAARGILLGAGLEAGQIDKCFDASRAIVKRALG